MAICYRSRVGSSLPPSSKVQVPGETFQSHSYFHYSILMQCQFSKISTHALLLHCFPAFSQFFSSLDLTHLNLATCSFSSQFALQLAPSRLVRSMDIGNHEGLFVLGAEILVHDANVAATVVILDEEILDTASTLDKRILSLIGLAWSCFCSAFMPSSLACSRSRFA